MIIHLSHFREVFSGSENDLIQGNFFRVKGVNKPQLTQSMQHFSRIPLPEHFLALFRFLATQSLDYCLKEDIFPSKMTIEGHNGNTSLGSNHFHRCIGKPMLQEQLFRCHYNSFLFALKQTSFW